MSWTYSYSDGDPIEATVKMRLEDGFGVLVGIEIARTDNKPLTIRDVRSIDFGKLTTRANALRGAQPHATRVNSTNPTELEKVAEIYRAALETGAAPTKAVQEAFSVSRRTASRLVSRSREAGHLGAAVRRRAGERTVDLAAGEFGGKRTRKAHAGKT
jgi:pyruvate/2-oxoglutarate dehydrogenase complex dihydrolipoamide acyltransferase (E2) component